MAIIGVFDSGIGGLTVLKVLAAEFPAHDFIYLGDTARLPYGSKSAHTIRKYSEQVIEYLISRKVDAIVIACNSASSQVSEKFWNNTDGRQIPIFNVIDPGSRAATQTTTTGRIGVLGTRATVASQIYSQKIKSQLPAAIVFSQACPLFVPLVEEAWIEDPVSNLIVYRYLQPLLQNDIDTLVLGCTHYPLLKNAIQRTCGSAVTLIDSGFAIAEEMKTLFGSASLAETGVPRSIQFLVTDLSPHTLAWAEEVFEPFEFSSFEVVDLI